MKKYAARVDDDHLCPLVEGGKPHVGGPLSPPGAWDVLIGGKQAIRVLDTAKCAGSLDLVKKGAPMVLIGGLHAARKGDPTVHTGVIMEGFPMVLIGGSTPPATDEEALDEAMNLIRTSEFGKTEEGKKVLAKLEAMKRNGDIRFKHFDGGIRGEYGSGGVSVNEKYNRDPDAIASELVHEATHGIESDNHIFPHGNTIDEEMHTNNNQLDIYEEQRDEGFRDPELERRRTARNNGTLRDDIRSRYPGSPEH